MNSQYYSMSRKGKSRRRRYGEAGREDVRGILLTQRVILDTKSRSSVSIPPASNFSRRTISVIPTARALLSRRLKVIDIRRHASAWPSCEGSRMAQGCSRVSRSVRPQQCRMDRVVTRGRLAGEAMRMHSRLYLSCSPSHSAAAKRKGPGNRRSFAATRCKTRRASGDLMSGLTQAPNMIRFRIICRPLLYPLCRQMAPQ